MPTTTINPSKELIEKAFKAQQAYSIQLRQSKTSERIRKLRRLLSAIENYTPQIEEALLKDFQKPPTETLLTEIFSTIADIKHSIKHLRTWMKPTEVSTPMTLLGSSSKIHYEPKGVCLIIAPWNYPFFLALGPLVYAIAAGNTAMIKPSELTPHTAQLIKQLIAETFEEKEVTVFEGGVDISTHLLACPFDHIFFTGSPQVGKIVMGAAAKNLTSVTLELGGKSPTIIDESANLSDAAEKITWGKFLNAGQTCIAPDYILVSKSQYANFLKKMKAAIEKAYNPNKLGIDASDSFARIVNEKHFNRLNSLLEDARNQGAEIAFGGQVNPETNFIAPTLLCEVSESMAVLQEEIFGPILPILTYSDKTEVVNIINSKPKPLAMYIFSEEKSNTNYYLENTSAGGVCVNDCVAHIVNPNLPFGGVNNSGIGKTHGIFGFKAFSNEKAVLYQRTGFTSLKPLYPPYNGTVRKMADMLVKWF